MIIKKTTLTRIIHEGNGFSGKSGEEGCLQEVGKGREHMYRKYGSRTMQEQLSRSGSFG